MEGLDDATFCVVNIEGLDRSSLQDWAKFYGLKANGTSKTIMASLAKKQTAVKKLLGGAKGVKDVSVSDKAPKLEDAPKLELEGDKVDVASYKIWRREVNEWRAEFGKHYNAKVLLISLMKQIPKKLKLQIYAELPEGSTRS